MACPVCNTPIPTKDATTCATCNWYFPLKDTPHFELELSRAKQQFQMVNSFQQVFQHMQIQSKMLEKMSFRLDGMENEIATITLSLVLNCILPNELLHLKIMSMNME